MFPFTLRALVLVLCETLLILLAVCIGARIRLEQYAWEILFSEGGVEKTLLAAGVTQLCLYYADLYNLRRLTDWRDTFVRLVQALGAASLILAATYYWFPALVIGRGVFAISATLVVGFVVGWRGVFVWLSRRLGPRERLLLVGTSPAAVALARELYERRHELGVEIVGFVDPDPARVGVPVLNPGVIGTVDDIPSIVQSRGVRPRGGEPGRRARQAADGSAARHEAGRCDVRPPRVGLRGSTPARSPSRTCGRAGSSSPRGSRKGAS